MEAHRKQNVVCESLAPHVRALRFVRPDLRSVLDDAEAMEDCTLYRELHGQALADLVEGETLIINFGLIEIFTSAFYRLLLKVREAVQAQNATLLLCCFTSNSREGFDLFCGGRLFEVTAFESQAAHKAHK
jgi:hypothetical protein